MHIYIYFDPRWLFIEVEFMYPKRPKFYMYNSMNFYKSLHPGDQYHQINIFIAPESLLESPSSLFCPGVNHSSNFCRCRLGLNILEFHIYMKHWVCTLLCLAPFIHNFLLCHHPPLLENLGWSAVQMLTPQIFRSLPSCFLLSCCVVYRWQLSG